MTNNVDQVGSVSASSPWRRLSPIALLYVAISSIKFVAGNFIYLIPILVIGWQRLLQNPEIIVPGVIVLFFFVSIFSWLQFRSYRYRISHRRVEIRFGVIKKTVLDLPFERIQNVTINQPLYYRFTEHVYVELETAGSSDQEAKLFALTRQYAEQLKDEISSSPSIASVENAQSIEQQATPAPETILNQRSIFDLILHGISSNRIWIMLGAMGPFAEEIYAKMGQALQYMNIDLAAILDLSNSSLTVIIFYTLSIILTLFLCLVTLSIMAAVVSFYGFTLSRRGEHFIRRSGLFTRSEVNIKLSRLQQIVFQRDWLDMLLGRTNIKFLQAGSSEKQQSSQTENLMVPSVTTEQANALSSQAWHDQQLENMTFNRISKRYIFSRVLIAVTLLLTASGLSHLSGDRSLIYFAASLTPVVIALIVLRWWRWGYTSDYKYLYIRKGLLGVDKLIVPLDKLQQLKWSQTVWQKPHHLGQLKLVLASGALSVPFMNQEYAFHLLNNTLERMATRKPAWM
ncbi:PH domain-containing protein [Veronia pacifica]|uniref:YdbS-like PH domain-containing protein n=1 Tax=Veronia pacifica TaxID=1080227 RepID=A0A1C3ER75_9GAMM|nr:PH domain-containing protein [Veronia pacifica]ODA35719.1 hypothetical protein A8L45_03685 [Veronia pacifica]